MVGSISWVINADEVRELLEPVQIRSVSTTPAPTTADLILDLLPRSPSSMTRRPLPRYQRRHLNNDDLIESIDRVGLRLGDGEAISELQADPIDGLDQIVIVDMPPLVARKRATSS